MIEHPRTTLIRQCWLAGMGPIETNKVLKAKGLTPICTTQLDALRKVWERAASTVELPANVY